MDEAGQHSKFWWEKRWFIGFLLLLSVVPLLWPTIPPLIDLPGHMGRYRVQLDINSDPLLQQFYHYDWALILNLGVDLLIELFGPIFGIELGTKLLVIMTTLLTAGGLLWIAREVHGRIPPTVMLALPLLYGYVTSYGFINYMLSVAIAFNLFAYWIYCDRVGKQTLRSWILVPASFILAICHVYGWGILGLLVFGYEFHRAQQHGLKLLPAAWRAGLNCIVLAGPVLILLLWRADASGHSRTHIWFNFPSKFGWVLSALRDRWVAFDGFSIVFLMAVLCGSIFSRQTPIAPSMRAPLALLVIAFLVVPFWLMSSAFADMRLVPALLMLWCAFISWPKTVKKREIQLAAAVALAFCGIRIAGNTASYYLYDRDFKRELVALDHIPSHARLYSATKLECKNSWFFSRKWHLPSIALVRNRAYANDQWVAVGAQSIRSKVNAPGYDIDRSQLVSPSHCVKQPKYDINRKLKQLPRDQFDYVWLIDVPSYDPKLMQGMTLLWSDRNSAVYRVNGLKPRISQHQYARDTL